MITGQTKINIIGGCAAIVFIHLLGKWCDFSQNNPRAMQFISTIYAILAYIVAFLTLFAIVGPALLKQFR